MQALPMIHIGNIVFSAIYPVAGLFFLISSFVIWYEGIKDGFDRERLFDLHILILVVWVILSYSLSKTLRVQENYVLWNHYVILYFAVFFLLIKIFTKIWTWSIFRILDIFSFNIFLGSIILFIYRIYVIHNHLLRLAVLSYSILYLVSFYKRNNLYSGLTFTIYLLILSMFGQLFFKEKQHLIFYFILITISMVNLFFRTRKIMFTRNISADFLEKVKRLLRKKDKRLSIEQKKLIETDPYLQEGRAFESSEELEEAILEDRAKLEHDIKKQSIGNTKKQVDKALNKLDKGEYGICEICGNPIDKARLEFYPEATTCVECAEKENARL